MTNRIGFTWEESLARSVANLKYDISSLPLVKEGYVSIESATVKNTRKVNRCSCKTMFMTEFYDVPYSEAVNMSSEERKDLCLKPVCPGCGNERFIYIDFYPVSIPLSINVWDNIEEHGKFSVSIRQMKAGLNRQSGIPYTKDNHLKVVFNVNTKRVYFLCNKGNGWRVQQYSLKYHNIPRLGDQHMLKLFELYNKAFPEHRVEPHHEDRIDHLVILGKYPQTSLLYNTNKFWFEAVGYAFSNNRTRVVGTNQRDILSSAFGVKFTKGVFDMLKTEAKLYRRTFQNDDDIIESVFRYDDLNDFISVIRHVGIDNARNVLRLRERGELESHIWNVWNGLAKVLPFYIQDSNKDKNVATKRAVKHLVGCGPWMITDILRMAKNLGVSIENMSKLSKDEVRRLHDNLMREQDRREQNVSEEKFAKAASAMKRHEYYGDSFKIIAPNNANELFEEGQEMRHCVAGYAERVANRDCQIFFLRDNSDNRIATIEVANKRIYQVKGKHNSHPTDQVIELVKSWGKENGFGFFKW